MATTPDKFGNINTAINEAVKFIARAKAYKESMDGKEFPWGNQYSAACRRTSMDLTKALAKMRKAMFP